MMANKSPMIKNSQKNVSNPIPQNTKTIIDILPDPSTYQKIHLNSPDISPNVKQTKHQVSASQDLSSTKRTNPYKGSSLKIQQFNDTEEEAPHEEIANELSTDQRQQDDKRDSLIQNLQEVNEKFRARVTELENLVATAVQKSETKDPLELAKLQNTIKVSDLGDPEVAKRNVQLQQLQVFIKQQKKEIKSLKIRLESFQDIQKNTDNENYVYDLERQNKENFKLMKTIQHRNNEQKKELDILANDANYEEQMQQIAKQINKWKEKQKLLHTYKKEEDLNFKQKFDQMIQVQENRVKIKETIINVKNNNINPFEDIRGSVSSKSVLVQSQRLQRVGSQPQIRKVKIQGAEHLLKTRNAMNKVLDQTTKRYAVQKKDLERQVQDIQNEVENLRYQITNTDKLNEFAQEELNEIAQIQKSQVPKLSLAHQRSPSSILTYNIKDQKYHIKSRSKDLTNIKKTSYKASEVLNHLQYKETVQSIDDALYFSNDSQQIQSSQQLLDITAKTIDSLNDRTTANKFEQQNDLSHREQPSKHEAKQKNQSNDAGVPEQQKPPLRRNLGTKSQNRLKV